MPRTLLSLLLLLFLAAPLRAHGTLKRTEPAAGSHLTAAPTALRLTFTEAMEASVARLVLTGPDGRAVPLSPIRRGDSATMIVADIVGPLGEGLYKVSWQGTGRDGHPVRGHYQFTIAAGATGLAPIPPAPSMSDTTSRRGPVGGNTARTATDEEENSSFDAQSVPYAAIRWLELVGMLTLVGTVAFALLVLPRVGTDDTSAVVIADAARGARWIGLVAAGMLCVVTLLRLIAQSTAMHGVLDAAWMSRMILGTLWGRTWLQHLVAAVMAFIGYLVLPRARTTGWLLVVLASVVLALTAALSGHAAAVVDNAGLAVAIDTVHVLGAGGWLGTLLLVVLAGLPAALRLAPRDRGRSAAALVNAFSPLALVFAAAVVTSGAGSAWLHLGSLGAIWTTTYGRVLLVKLGVISCLFITGAWNWRWVKPALGDERGVLRMRRSATVELLIGAAVLMVTAVLMATGTPASP
jgi:putative copper export protein/methionine-rich copper-binding protein CopC